MGKPSENRRNEAPGVTLTPQEAGTIFDSYRDLLERESDRGAVIVGSAILDDLLRELLVARLVPAAATNDELLGELGGHSAPCSSFSPRIDLAYRVGAITAYLRTDLHLIRRMRNDAAHAGAHRDFESPEIRDRLRELVSREGGLLDLIMKTVLPRLNDEGDTASLDTYLATIGKRASWNNYVSYLALVLIVMTKFQKQITTPNAPDR